MKTYKYKKLVIGGYLDLDDDKFKKLGKKGWKLAGIYNTQEMVHRKFQPGQHTMGADPDTFINNITCIFVKEKERLTNATN